MDSVLYISGLSGTWSCAVTAANAEIAFSWGCVHWWGTGGYDTAHDEDDNTNSIWAGCKQAPTSARRRRKDDDATGRENEIWGGEFGDGMHCTATQQPAQLCSVCGTNNNLLPIIPCYTTFYQILVFITNQTFQMFLFSIHVIRFRTLKLRIPPSPRRKQAPHPL